MFQPVDGNVNFPEQELAVGKFWKEHGIYEKSLAQRKGAKPFVFYEGPPTANGMPHPGHCLTRAIKDLFPRYQTMRGRLCERKAGWDTHGLPVEVEVCKELGIHSKEEIEAYGIEKFIQLCQKSVWRYMQEWRRLTERIGFWVDLDDAYVTYHQSYVESVWWSLKNLFDRGLLYQGHKIVWWWAQGGTALSAGEVGQGYRQVADPSVYVKFPLLDDDGEPTGESLLVWTTTPWTLPSNQFVAVNRNLTYARMHDPETGETLILAYDLHKSIESKIKRTLNFVSSLKGRELLDRRYLPPFEFYWRQRFRSQWHLPDAQIYAQKEATFAARNVSPDETLEERAAIDHERGKQYLASRSPDNGWQIVPGDFVTTDAGTGLVHIAPAFGEDDMRLLERRRSLLDPDPSLLNAVAPDGKFTLEAPDYCQGRWVKDCDKDIIRDLKQRGLLFHQEQYLHDYPFCWRAEEDPLIQYPRMSWFIRTSDFKGPMVFNNRKINWLPDHIRDGRFGKFLESNVDWALSRERYWGTPLPIWMCSETGTMEAVGSYGELLAKPGVSGTEYWDQAKAKHPELPDDLRVHKPYIDYVEYDSRFAKGARMRRVSEVIDCWYDSGAMPFAQWGYRGPNGPRDASERFRSQFPADFISEALDQTRGWFYSQLAISTLLFGRGLTETEAETLPGDLSAVEYIRRAIAANKEDSGDDVRKSIGVEYPHPFKNCIVLGLMLGEDGNKMSKSKRNYREPNEIFDKFGADALRWYFFANQPPWTSIRYSEQAIKDSIPEFLLRLWNVYSFFVIYANIDGFDPGSEGVGVQGSGFSERESASLSACVFASAPTYRTVKERGELDRWILSELNRTVAAVVERMDAYDNFGACGHVTEFVDALSNWYVRRSRDRFWAADKRAIEKLDAYWTLYECLVTTAKLVAPFVPFLAETLWQNLAGVFKKGTGSEQKTRGSDNTSTGEVPVPFLNSGAVAESVHLCNYPIGDFAVIDEALSARMNLVREISSLGRNARSAASLKVRQPLAKVEVVLADTTHQKWLEEHADLIAEELNVKAIEFTTRGDQYISYSVVPNFKRLGPRLGKNMPAGKKLLAEIDAAKLLAELKSVGKSTLTFPDGSSIELDNDDIEVRLQAKKGWAAAQGKGSVVVLSTELTTELIAEGLARDIVRLIQDQRKDTSCEYTDRIRVGLVTQAESLANAIEKHYDFIAQETLATEIVDQPLDGVTPTEAKMGGEALTLYVQVTS
ncbi:MAG: class I tRNA ligase family protein [Pirellulales bacterium]